jgi:hypothetical protein
MTQFPWDADLFKHLKCSKFGTEDPDWLPFSKHGFPILERILLSVNDTQLFARAARKMLGNEVRFVFYWGLNYPRL